MRAWGEAGQSFRNHTSRFPEPPPTAIEDTEARETEAKYVVVVDLDTESDAQPPTPSYEPDSDSSAKEENREPTVAELRLAQVVNESAEAMNRGITTVCTDPDEGDEVETEPRVPPQSRNTTTAVAEPPEENREQQTESIVDDADVDEVRTETPAKKRNSWSLSERPSMKRAVA